jgi:7-cyano-7-deazaguanine synthase in queuosine biosynthesis
MNLLQLNECGAALGRAMALPHPPPRGVTEIAPLLQKHKLYFWQVAVTVLAWRGLHASCSKCATCYMRLASFDNRESTVPISAGLVK